MNKVSFNNLRFEELRVFLEKNKQPSYRLEQILEWAYGRDVDDFSLMTNLPKDLISKLTETFVITNPQLHSSQLSSDGTKKYVLEMQSGVEDENPVFVECVAIPSLKESSNKLTICISSQAGCPMACEFCATGQQGFVRNLRCGEIVQQVLFIQNDLKMKVSNVVVMGQGEPFLNFENLTDALDIINNPKIIGIGARKITVSTCGIIPGIDKFSKIEKQYGLAISLHSAIQEKRNQIMPGVKNYTLDKLKDSIENYIAKTNRRPTFEYLLINNVNDTQEDLNALINFCEGMLCHVNLIKFNDVNGSKFKASSNAVVDK